VVSRRRVAQGLIVVALATAAFLFLAQFATRHGSFDLKVYYGAVNYWLHGDGEVYDYVKPYSRYGFTYPPFAAILMAPMAILPWWAANALTIAGTVVCTLVVLYWLLRPVADRQGWSRWFTVAVAAVLVAVFEPLRETVSFGQVNMMLLFLVLLDFRCFIRHGSRYGGIAVGLATAIKLTPGIFILYLLITRQIRPALTAMVTTVSATVLAMLIAPDASREFWTSALWDTDRVGTLSFISNQSLEGFVARLHPTNPSTALWAVLVVATLAVWVVRAWRAGDELTGVALTGVAGCLVSPVTWVHHMVWTLPALLLLLERGLAARGRLRWTWLGLCAGLYCLLSSKIIWDWQDHYTGAGLLLSNMYVYATVALLLVVPLGAPVSRERPRVADLGQLDDRTVRAGDRVPGGGSVDGEAGPLVETPRLVVRGKHP
jgi:alpha-1,2-mannosyltransferase